MLRITDDLVIEDEVLQLEFVRAQGPGGQNVNKVASAVQLTLDVARCAAFTPAVRERLARLAGKRMTGDGRLIVMAQRFRSQEQNRNDALERLAELVRRALTAPRPRRPTRPSNASRERRLDAKHRRGLVKHRRRAPAQEDA